MVDRPGRVRSYRKTYRWTKTQRQRVLKRFGRRCAACGDPGSDGKGKGLHQAHILDHALGGADVDSNIWLLCASCHRRWDAGKRVRR